MSDVALDQEFYKEIASYKGDELESYIESVIESRRPYKKKEVEAAEEKQACPTDPFLRVMCEGCQ